MDFFYTMYNNKIGRFVLVISLIIISLNNLLLALIFLGIIGEYVISIQRSVRKLPIVTEKERIHYDV